MTAWLYLFGAITLEVAGTISMKLADGFTKLLPSFLVFFFYMLSLACLTMALKQINISIAYAIWAGIGTALIAVIGIVFFKEPLSMIKVGSLALIIIGVAGLHLGGSN